VTCYSGFGNLADGDERPVFVGDFDGDGQDEVLFYYAGDRNWWMGHEPVGGGTLAWSLVGNTAGFGQVWDGRPFWVGKFSRSDRDEVLFYYPGDKNWWVGTFSGTTLSWSLAGNTAGFGQVADGRPFWVGDFNGGGQDDILFYYPGDKNWWLGTFSGSTLSWSLAGNTSGFGQVWDGRPFWVGDFNGDGRDDVLFYYQGDKNWWLGTFSGNTLGWSLAGNTAGFGQVWDGRPFWLGKFSRSDRSEVLFYYPGDGNWWLGSHNGSVLGWSFAGNSGRPCEGFVRIHFKTLIPNTNAVQNFMDTQFAAMEDLFSQRGLACYRGTTEDLSGNAALAPLANLNVGNCMMGQPTADHNTLFANRNNADDEDLVIYVVQTLIGGAGNFVGCATHPDDQPGAAIVQSGARWLLAHEVGHVLDLRHVSATPTTNADFLMWPNTSWTNVPPDVTEDEADTMLDSDWAQDC
jgi:hypothetical protein